ncbi:hypothetical protein JWV37_10335 [Sulfurospirillum sp. T05]|uniref:Uncharacterized protein n=1 Tax=Sulfurospirillum tamanense TaxID=2813362 RepID=A0ABS2WU40_9BACT|nr:hypothetical protein [Sulfurospirillum tamanensis]MBN2965179.1 hypothetical protein [Sulfurospirillum tamanensis]
MAIPLIATSVGTTIGGYLAAKEVGSWGVKIAKASLYVLFLGGLWLFVESAVLLFKEIYKAIDILIDLLSNPATISGGGAVLNHLMCALHASGVISGFQTIQGTFFAILGLKVSYIILKTYSIIFYSLYTGFTSAVSK